MLSAIGIFTLIVVNSRFYERFKELTTVFKYQKDEGDNSINVKRIRVIAFNAFLEQDLQTKILGAGTGDTQEYLDSYYEENVIVDSDKYEKKWNIKGLHYHNQFLQNLGESGVFGLVIIMLIVGFSIYFALKNKNMSHSLFIISCSLFFLVDSFLIRHRGIVFFSLFNLLFIYEDVLQKKFKNYVE
jgi:O-antigen ligase